MIDALRERGIAHELAYLEQLKGSGLVVSEDADDETSTEGTARTSDAMAAGADVIYQAALADDTWAGRADFLRKTSAPSSLGDWSYEVVDTKLAQETKAGTILQLCVYSYLLGKLQNKIPTSMHVVTPEDGTSVKTYRIDDYSAYFRLLERGVTDFTQESVPTYPEMVPHCDLCAWWDTCETRRREDDHLCYVAGISASQIQWLKENGIERLEQLALCEDLPKPSRGSLDALIRSRDQARAQQIGRQDGKPYHRLKEPLDDEHGFALLPEPTPDDIFLDFEGSHFAEDGVQEYLTGYVTKDTDGNFMYTPLWATTLEEEKHAFEQFIDHATAVHVKNPQAHIYHFAAYEQTALKRLMGRFATRGVQLDELLRGKMLVDLLTIVKRSLYASVEGYSIKNLECFFGYERKQDLHQASMSRRILEAALETNDVSEVMTDHQKIIEEYNREDCESTSHLRDWLEQLRAEAIDSGAELPRPEAVDSDASDTIKELDARLLSLRDALLDGVPAEPDDRTEDQLAKFKLAHMMEFYRRESKAAYWEKFRLADLDYEDYRDERRALAELEFVEIVTDGKAPVHRYRFPAQDLDARLKDDLYDDNNERFGSVAAVDYANETIDIKKTMKAADRHLSHVVLFNMVPAGALQESLIRLGEAVIANAFNTGIPYGAAVKLLLRVPPQGDGEAALQMPGEDTLQAACRIVMLLDGEVLPIQGPPGTGKTFTGGEMICELVKQGKKVGVTAVSHKVILNLLKSTLEAADRKKINVSCVHNGEGDNDDNHGIEYTRDYKKILAKLEAEDVNILGGTAWQWARPEFAQTVDVLFVDEAGQMSLSNVLATAQAARSLVLLGDPQQLEQPLQSSHPEGSEISALHHLLDGEETMPDDKGLFLGTTWRLHPELSKFTSEVYYASRLTALPSLENQAILNTEKFGGSGLRFVPVSHQGNQARSNEEIDVIETIVNELTNSGVRWQSKDKKELKVGVDDILIVAPYNSQVAALAERLPELATRIGTVDRFQGQEAPIVIYSMTSSSPEDAPRGMEFLYNPNRFNVATSRARALCILVGSPALFEPNCKTPGQMKMANGFCRFRELAEIVELQLSDSTIKATK